MDENGVRADIVVDPNATFSRMNLARLFEHYTNSVYDKVLRDLRGMFHVTGKEKGLRQLVEQADAHVVQKAWELLMYLYRTISPRQYHWFESGQYTESREHHLTHVLKEGIYLHVPTDNEPEYMSYVDELEKHVQPTYSYVTYQNEDGQVVRSKNKVRISTLYMLLLEKTGKDWTATSSAKLQQHGILAPLTATDKYSTPVKQQPARSLGEAEIRNYASYVDPFVTSDVLDRNNNPIAHKVIVKNILAAEQPTNIEVVIDREQYPLGNSKPLQIVKHMNYCAGYAFNYLPHDELSHAPPETKHR